MKAVWKFQFGTWQTGMVSLSMPADAQIYDVQIQDGEPVMWALVDPDAEKEQRHFVIIGTGHQFGGSGHMEYIATFQWGSFVGHVFEVFK